MLSLLLAFSKYKICWKKLFRERRFDTSMREVCVTFACFGRDSLCSVVQITQNMALKDQ
jgi:hypothetical protein